MTTTHLVVLCLAVLVGAFIQGASGIGFALIFAPVAGLVDPMLLPVTLLGLMLPVNLFILLRERGHVDLRGAGWISVARIVSTPAGIWLLTAVPPDRLGLLIGVSTILAAVISLVSPAFTPSRTAYLAVGAVTGVSETATGVGGPPLALVYQHRPAPELRSTLALCFLVGEVTSLLMLFWQGDFAGPSSTTLAAMLAVLGVGLWSSTHVHHRISNSRLRTFVLGFAIVSGGVLVLGA